MEIKIILHDHMNSDNLVSIQLVHIYIYIYIGILNFYRCCEQALQCDFCITRSSYTPKMAKSTKGLAETKSVCSSV